MATCDLVIVGAGPAGMGAAVEARERGLSVMVLDEQAGPGGQIYRGIEDHAANFTRLGTDPSKGLDLAQRLRRSGAHYQSVASVWFITPDGEIAYSVNGRAQRITAQRVLLATGAIERPCPLPGWTLPGVMTAGAAQILLKSAGVACPDAVFAGSGPLLYLAAAQYVRRGVPVRAVLDTTPAKHYLRAAGQWRSALGGFAYLRQGWDLLRQLRQAGVPIIHGVTGLHALGQNQLESIQFQRRRRWQTLDDVSGLFLHQGVVPNIQAALVAQCDRSWDERAQCWRIVTDAFGRTSQPAIYLAGDAAAITGATCAPMRGRLAALAIAHALGRIDAGRFQTEAQHLRRQLQRDAAVRPFLETLYQPAATFTAPPDLETVVCRCEEVRAREIRGFLQAGGRDPNQFKSGHRCGMGPCQGRMCALTLGHLMSAHADDGTMAGALRIRPPIVPVPFAELASLVDDEGMR